MSRTPRPDLAAGLAAPAGPAADLGRTGLAPAFAALVVGALAMGLSPVLVRLVSPEVGPFASAFWRVALALPALLRAEKLQKRAARQGFDWTDLEGPMDKLREEMDELAAAGTEQDRIEEAGDLLFAAVNVARAYGVAPEDALRAANRKFERRFRGMEELARARGVDFAGLTIDQQEALWTDVKASEANKAP